MDTKIIFHGSGVIVSKPDIRRSRADTDFGMGFYCTEDEELAKEWACDDTHSGYMNCYEMDLSELKILNLNSDDYSTLNWLALLVNNRSTRVRVPLQREMISWITKNYLIDISDYDVIIGYRADDSYFDIINYFLMNTISYEQLSSALTLGDWGDQFVLKSEKAYSQIRFIEATTVDHRVYYPKRMKRDEKARADFFSMIKEVDMKGTYIRDLIMKK